MIVLAVVQGVAEFLPISSSGHLAVLGRLFGIEEDANETLAILLHAGSLLAILVFYFKTLLGFLKPQGWHLAGMVILGTIPAGIAVGSSRRLRAAAEPFSRVLGAIPPIVYIPYAIALLPSFRSASIFVIWSGAFWPVFVNTVSGVVTIPDSLLDSARMLHLKRSVFFFRILLPGAMPSILTGASLGLIFSFLLLTAAELIGATEGLGWYVKNFSDFADYGRVIVGILFIGIVVTSLMWLFNKLERRLLRYRRNIHD